MNCCITQAPPNAAGTVNGNAPAIKDVAELAKDLNVTPQTVRRMISEGELPASKLGRKWYVRTTDLMDVFDRKEVANG